ncbi:polyprenyl synthetase family protein [Streptomyces broussonetiae]|uniref:Polyprenyl synthetase family protein n=1 Tax=Streptomyces broussonetiae TaxID=2686304 RepID=A0A6I6N2R6_9ACTN|nr:polyprenyl synthetase family protein [Streptomyces broussonetiae]QHA03145.1 polyprenyl synthetase family protein [Streptomyces broussonetiae]
MVTPLLHRAVTEFDHRLRPVIAHHFGWPETDLPPATTSGKMVRATLTVLAGECFTDDAAAISRVAAAGAAVEMIHNFSLIHDDVMDGDAERRGRPAVWHEYGVPAAILAGDLLLAQAPLMLNGSSASYPEATRLLADTVTRLAAGQMADLTLEGRAQTSPDEALAVASDKTAALLACACELGALLAGASGEATRRFNRFGLHLGLAFQIADDILGIWGDPRRTGKPVGSDLRNRKGSFPVTAALASGTPEAAELARFYAGQGPVGEEEARHITDLVTRAGGRVSAVREIERFGKLAREELGAVRELPVERTTPLLSLTDYVASRNH